MHMQGTPRTMQANPIYQDVVVEVAAFLRHRRNELVAAGIPQDRIAVDPGIGFGKTVEHNLALLRNAWRLHELGCAVLVGPSRKGFIRKSFRISFRAGPCQSLRAGRVCPEDLDLTAGTIGVAIALAQQGIQILRVHDVGPVRQALALFESTGGGVREV